MGHYDKRATADELFAEATAARDAASQEMENWRAHVEALESAGPEDQEALVFQVQRSERIVAAELATATSKAREAARLRTQASSVS